ncbi:XRE family transcriptional regulator [Streptomyces sp. NPDC059477]|uniref:XRE family transcriptional regulator n=1 Tax=Streptomyces sp. NPDC059477 TaxID=3346847 RepID=UPI0036A5EC7A
MTPSPGPAKPPPLPATPKRGRPPAPISQDAGPVHRAWLEPVRTILFSGGLTLDDLVERSGYSKTRISELLRGNGYYPAWEITFSVTHALGLPAPPLRRLWAAGAREARKGDGWIEYSIAQVAHDGHGPPLPYQAFTQRMAGTYADYARAFLLTDRRARYVVREAFDMLWVCWNHAVTSENLHRYAWRLFRSRVMIRASRWQDGRVDLRPAVFSTHEVHDHAAAPGHLVVLTELVDLFDAITRLPEDQLDVVVLRHLCGIPHQRIADVLGHAHAITHAVDHHARAALKDFLRPSSPPTPE